MFLLCWNSSSCLVLSVGQWPLECDWWWAWFTLKNFIWLCVSLRWVKLHYLRLVSRTGWWSDPPFPVSLLWIWSHKTIILAAKYSWNVGCDSAGPCILQLATERPWQCQRNWCFPHAHLVYSSWRILWSRDVTAALSLSSLFYSFFFSDDGMTSVTCETCHQSSWEIICFTVVLSVVIVTSSFCAHLREPEHCSVRREVRADTVFSCSWWNVCTLLHVDFFVLSGTTVWNRDIVIMKIALPLEIFFGQVIHVHRA